MLTLHFIFNLHQVHVLFPFVNKLANAQVRLENKKKYCGKNCGRRHNQYGHCTSDEELFERSEQETLIMEEMKETVKKLNLTKSESNVRYVNDIKVNLLFKIFSIFFMMRTDASILLARNTR